ncbi:amidase domain-containing protein [Staphylococcus hominis]|uniref:amidase domain-containing protein n=1 Tax=Staphylococcus hominis TaxID=1290 RepID=UPI0011609892|nr:amidase domain-containing protein [Staphylococcus hominis]TRM03983.1 amidase domain-containing protein [Staphylococcus hominis]
MSKQKFMIYLLTTTLVLPTFTSSVAQAEENTKQTKTSESNHEDSTSTSETTRIESNETPSSEESTSDSSDNNKKQESQSKESQSDTTSNEDASSHSKSSLTHSKNNSSSHTKDEDTYHTPLSVFNINDSNHSFSSNFLDPSHFENGFSLTSLISSLFHFDDDISKYEHVKSDSSSSNTNDDKNATNTTSSDEDSTESSHQRTTIDASSQDVSDKSNSHVTSSNQSDVLTENSQSDQPSESSFKYSNSNDNHSTDDSSVSKALDSLNQLASDLNDSSNNESSTSDNNDQSTSQQTTKNTTSQEEQATSNKDSQQSEDVLDALLDKYSDKAQQTHKDYTSSKKDSTSQTSQNEGSKNSKATTQNQTSTNKDNPQLPTEKQLKHKQEAPQSFENDFKQSNTRAISLFQDVPRLDGNNVTNGNMAVVENKATREFITSIAKDAHKIGQDNDIYASVMIAQAILESSSGNSSLAQAPNYNLFGMKGSYKGASVNFNTLEASSDNTIFSINASFRKYPNLKASLKDYAHLIKHGIDGNSTIYKSSWKNVAPTYRSATRHLSQTYATDPNYATKLNSLIEHYNLTDFDKKHMPDLDKYSKSTGSNGTDVSGNAFKPFSISDVSSPYPYGQCTWYVYERVQQFDKHVGGQWGDAHNWDNSAEDAGYSVSTTPKNHTAVVFEAGQSGASALYGHVAFVEKVNDDGSIIISESNVKGLGIVSYRQIDADTTSSLHYIQPK